MNEIGFTQAVKKLGRVGIRPQFIYLVDLVLLCEMAWADGSIQDGEKELVVSYLNHHIDAINRLAGCRVLTQHESREFVRGLLSTPPDDEVVAVVREVITTIRLDAYDDLIAERTSLTILNACLDIAASSVTRYPYGLTERFSEEEKECYHRIAATLLGPQWAARCRLHDGTAIKG